MQDLAVALPQERETVSSAPIRFAFTGRGGEYFRIWIVNVLLSIATLGIYSAWAKVRRERYFHRNTRLAGATFDYHARPEAILRGRLIAVGAFLFLQLSALVHPVLNLAAALALMAAVPWLIVRAMRFRLHNTSHRGIRFRFHGRSGESYRVFLLFGLLTIATVGLALPLFAQRQTRFLVDHAAFGRTRFANASRVSGFYAVYALGFGLLIAIAAAVGGGTFALLASLGVAREAGVTAAIFAGYAAGFAAFVPFFQARLQNLVWSSTRLGPHGFVSDQRFGSLCWLLVSNVLATIATLGLFRPFAVVRSARYRAEHLALVPGDSLDAIVADAASSASATGEELAEVFDFDVSL